MDWLTDFQERFEGCEVLKRLKEKRFFGKVVINFCEGVPQVVHIEWCVRGKRCRTEFP